MFGTIKTNEKLFDHDTINPIKNGSSFFYHSLSSLFSTISFPLSLQDHPEKNEEDEDEESTMITCNNNIRQNHLSDQVFCSSHIPFCFECNGFMRNSFQYQLEEFLEQSQLERFYLGIWMIWSFFCVGCCLISLFLCFLNIRYRELWVSMTIEMRSPYQCNSCLKFYHKKCLEKFFEEEKEEKIIIISTTRNEENQIIHSTVDICPSCISEKRELEKELKLIEEQERMDRRAEEKRMEREKEVRDKIRAKKKKKKQAKKKRLAAQKKKREDQEMIQAEKTKKKKKKKSRSQVKKTKKKEKRSTTLKSKASSKQKKKKTRVSKKKIIQEDEEEEEEKEDESLMKKRRNQKMEPPIERLKMDKKFDIFQVCAISLFLNISHFYFIFF